MDTSLLSRYNPPVQDVEPPKQPVAENVPSADNPVADFVRDCVSEGPGGVTSDIMRGAFNAWAAEKQIEGLNTRKLYDELRRLGFKAKKDNGFYWANIAVKGKYAKAAKRTQSGPTAIKQKRDEVSKFARILASGPRVPGATPTISMRGRSRCQRPSRAAAGRNLQNSSGDART